MCRGLTTYPTVDQAREAVNAAGYRIKLAQANMLPTITGSASYNYIHPTGEMAFEHFRFDIEPNSNYSAGVTLSQLIWGFGKNRPNVEAARLREQIAQIEEEQ